MSPKPSLLKSPATGAAPLTCAQPGMLDAAELVTWNVPLPYENATGTDPQPDPPTSAMSPKPSLLKSPATGLAPLTCAQDGMFATAELVTWNVPLPYENATGTDPQPDPPTSAMSPTTSSFKSPDTGLG